MTSESSEEISKKKFGEYFTELNNGVHPGLDSMAISSQYVSERDFYFKRAMQRYLISDLARSKEPDTNVKKMILSDLDNNTCHYSKRLSLESIYQMPLSERVLWIKENQKEITQGILDQAQEEKGNNPHEHANLIITFDILVKSCLECIGNEGVSSFNPEIIGDFFIVAENFVHKNIKKFFEEGGEVSSGVMVVCDYYDQILSCFLENRKFKNIRICVSNPSDVLRPLVAPLVAKMVKRVELILANLWRFEAYFQKKIVLCYTKALFAFHQIFGNFNDNDFNNICQIFKKILSTVENGFDQISILEKNIEIFILVLNLVNEVNLPKKKLDELKNQIRYTLEYILGTFNDNLELMEETNLTIPLNLISILLSFEPISGKRAIEKLPFLKEFPSPLLKTFQLNCLKFSIKKNLLPTQRQNLLTALLTLSNLTDFSSSYSIYQSIQSRGKKSKEKQPVYQNLSFIIDCFKEDWIVTLLSDEKNDAIEKKIDLIYAVLSSVNSFQDWSEIFQEGVNQDRKELKSKKAGSKVKKIFEKSSKQLKEDSELFCIRVFLSGFMKVSPNSV